MSENKNELEFLIELFDTCSAILDTSYKVKHDFEDTGYDRSFIDQAQGRTDVVRILMGLMRSYVADKWGLLPKSNTNEHIVARHDYIGDVKIDFLKELKGSNPFTHAKEYWEKNDICEN